MPPYLEKLVGNMSLEGMMYVVESEPDSANLTFFVNNGGGYLNHKMYFATMAPPGSPGQREPTGALLDAIDAQFGNFTAFKDEMTSQAKSVFGSGWAFLVVDPENSNGLLVTSRPNQNSPYMDGVIPILGLDVWEHAYYLGKLFCFPHVPHPSTLNSDSALGLPALPTVQSTALIAGTTLTTGGRF